MHISKYAQCLTDLVRQAYKCKKPGFHTCVSRTHNGARCLTMYEHQWSQAISSFAKKPASSHVLNFYEGLRGLCRDMLWLWSIETNNAKNKEYFLFCKKKSKPKTKKILTTFGKSLFLIKYRIRYAIFMPPNTKELAINQTMVTYGNRPNATAFARANNSDLLRSLKHLMETRLCCLSVFASNHMKAGASMRRRVSSNLNFHSWWFCK